MRKANDQEQTSPATTLRYPGTLFSCAILVTSSLNVIFLSTAYLTLIMLMVPQTHIPARPRLTPRSIRRINTRSPLRAGPPSHAIVTKRLPAVTAPLTTDLRLQNLATDLAGLTIRPIRRTPGVQARLMAGYRLRAGTLELDAQLA